MSQLPTGWVATTLAEIADVRLGRQRSPKNHSGDNMVPYLRAANVTWRGLALDDVKEMNFTGKEVATYSLKQGDIVVSEASGSQSEVGKPAIWNNELPVCCIQNTLLRVRSKGADPRFLFLLLRYEATSGRLGDAARGVGIHHIGKARLASWPVALPPLEEQHRIVEAIEGRLSRLDAAETALSRAELRVDLLGDRLRARAVNPPGVPEVPLAELSVLVTDGDHRPPPRVPQGIPHLTAKNVKRGRLTLDGCSFLSPEGFEQTRRRYEPLEGDVIVTCVGTVGETAVVPPGLVFSADRNLAAVRVGERLIPEYLREVLATRSMRESLTVASGSTAQPHLYLKDLRRVRIPTPEIHMQRAIVEQVETEMALVDQLRSAILRGRQRSAQLRRSILQQAFTGQLVPQDPSDVRASAMLDRCQSVPAGPAI